MPRLRRRRSLPRCRTDMKAQTHLVPPSERLSKADVKRRSRFETLAARLRRIGAPDGLDVGLEPEVDSQRPERRLVAHAESDGTAKVGDIELPETLEHVSRVDEADDAQSAVHRHAKLAVEHDRRVPADRKSIVVNGVRLRVSRIVPDTKSIEREAADRRIAACEEALRLGNGIIGVEFRSHPETRASCDDDATGSGE